MAFGEGIFSDFRIWARARNYARQMRANHANYDVIILSFPKCGRTWHRILLGRYLAGITGSDIKNLIDLDRLCEAAGAKRVHYSHNAASPTHRVPASHALVGSPLEWAGKDVIVLVRDPRDTMVSMYFHMKFREKKFDGSISEFLRSEDVGVAKMTAAWKRWHENRHLAKNFIVQSYEEMHRDPKRILKDILRMLGLTKTDEKIMDEAIEFASFGNLREMESTNFFKSDALNNESGDPRAAKVRTGKVGGYKEKLSPEDIAYIETAVREIGDPFGTLTPASQ